MTHIGFHRAIACLFALLLGTALSACGGGGGTPSAGSSRDPDGSTGDAGTTPEATTGRVSRLRYDFDANGIIEGNLVVNYDSLGRVASETYTYTDDGTPDASFPSFSIGAAQENFVYTYSYDANGRISRWVMTEGGSTTTLDYVRDAAGRVTTLDMTMDDGAIPYQVVHTVTHLAGLPTTILMQISVGATTQDILRHELVYGADGQLLTDTTITLATSTSEIASYVWRSDGLAARIERTDGAGALLSTVDLDYDSSNRLISRLATSATGAPYRWRWDYTLRTWTIDLGDNGSIEAIVHTDVESGPCSPTVMWMPGAEPNAPSSDTLPVIPGAGYSVVPYCAAS